MPATNAPTSPSLRDLGWLPIGASRSGCLSRACIASAPSVRNFFLQAWHLCRIGTPSAEQRLGSKCQEFAGYTIRAGSARLIGFFPLLSSWRHGSVRVACLDDLLIHRWQYWRDELHGPYDRPIRT